MKKTHRPVESPSRDFRGLICYAVIALACILVYGQTIHFGLTKFDDDKLLGAVRDRPGLLADVFMRDAFLRKEGAIFYRPLQTLTYMADVQFGGKDAYGCHGTNLLLYVLACCALFSLLKRLGHGHGLALVSVLVYSLNPLFTQVVAWIPARGDLLLALFAVLSFIALIRFRETGMRQFLVLHLVAFFLALLSKETAVMLPAVFFVYIVLQDGAKTLLNRQKAVLLISWGALLGAYLMLRRGAIGGGPGPDVFGLRPFIRNLATIPETLSSFIWPINLSVMPSFTTFRTIMGLALILVIVARVAMQRVKCWAPILFGTVWFLMFSVPAMFHSLKMGIHAYSYLNHRTFLPLMGVLIVAVELVPMKWRVSCPWALYGGGALLAGVLAALSFQHSRFFADPLTFHNQAVRTNPKSAMALHNRGCVRYAHGDLRGAVEDYSRALQIVPNYFSALLSRGMALNKLGDDPAALADFTAVIRASSFASNRTSDQAVLRIPELALVLYNRACIRYDHGDLRGAVEDYSRALQIDPDDFWARINRGVAMSQLGDYPAAIADLTAAIRKGTSPAEDLAKAYHNRAAFKAMAGDQAGALEDFAEAIRRAPEQPDIYTSRGDLRHKMGDDEGALLDLEKARELDPRLPEPLFNIGIIKHERNDEVGARAAWQAAAALGHKGAQEMLRRQNP